MLNVKNLSKNYSVTEIKENRGYLANLFSQKHKKQVPALQDLTFSVKAGEAVGLIGHNGAGKSTLIKILTGILKKTSGEVTVFGNDPFACRQQNNRYISAVFGQKTQLRWDLAPYESYKVLAAMYEVPWEMAEKRVIELAGLLDATEFLHTPVRNLSLGQKMKAELIAAFLYEPKLVFLDEPTLGLDVFTKEKVLAFIRSMKGRVTIIFTTHDLKDIAETCDRIVVLKGGQLVFDGAMNEVKSYLPAVKDIRLVFEGAIVPLAGLLEKYPHQRLAENEVLFKDVANGQFLELMAQIQQQKLQLKSLNIYEPDFEMVVKQILKNEEVAL